MLDFRSDRQRVENAFAKLETQGFLTLTGEVCCNSCSQGALAQRYGLSGDMPPLYAYYCEQDAEAFNPDGSLWKALVVGWGDDEDRTVSDRIAAALKAEGMEVAWSGRPEEKIHVLPASGRFAPEHLPEPEPEWDDDEE